MRVLVIGLGSAGRRHAAAALALGHEAAALRRAAVGADGIPVFADPAEALAWAPDAVVVATPTAEHLAGLRWAVGHGLPVLVEKPLADRPDGVEDVLAAASAPVGVAYNLRFHPALEAIAAAVAAGRLGRLLSARAEVGQFLPDWHPQEDYRAGYAARADLGGGALATLSHELDFVRWIAGEIVSCGGIRARVSALELDVDDVAELVCRHENGAVSSVHVDFLDRAYHRRCRFVGEEASAEWRWGGPAVLECCERRELLWDDHTFDVDDTYRAQLADFLDAAAAKHPPRASGADGLRVVELIGAVDADL